MTKLLDFIALADYENLLYVPPIPNPILTKLRKRCRSIF